MFEFSHVCNFFVTEVHIQYVPVTGQMQLSTEQDLTGRCLIQITSTTADIGRW